MSTLFLFIFHKYCCRRKNKYVKIYITVKYLIITITPELYTMTDRITLKNRAYQRLSETSSSPVQVTLVYLLISFVVNIIVGKLNEPVSVWLLDALDFYQRLGFTPHIKPLIIPSYVLIILLETLMRIISVGYMSYALGISRKKTVRLENLGDGFYRFWKLIAIFFLTWIFVIAWSILLVIPGIIASYRYRLAYYIALDRPELSPLECIRESKRLMRGYKMDLFILDLSFLGWYILGSVTFGIALIWKLPYIEVTYALFYQELAFPYGRDL